MWVVSTAFTTPHSLASKKLGSIALVEARVSQICHVLCIGMQALSIMSWPRSKSRLPPDCFRERRHFAMHIRLMVAGISCPHGLDHLSDAYRCYTGLQDGSADGGRKFTTTEPSHSIGFSESDRYLPLHIRLMAVGSSGLLKWLFFFLAPHGRATRPHTRIAQDSAPVTVPLRLGPEWSTWRAEQQPPRASNGASWLSPGLSLGCSCASWSSVKV